MTPQSHCNPHSQKGHAPCVSVTQGRTHTSLSLTIALTLRDKITLPVAQAPTAPTGRADSRGCAPAVHALSASRNPTLTATGCPSWAPATSAQSSSRRPKRILPRTGATHAQYATRATEKEPEVKVTSPSVGREVPGC